MRILPIPSRAYYPTCFYFRTIQHSLGRLSPPLHPSYPPPRHQGSLLSIHLSCLSTCDVTYEVSVPRAELSAIGGMP